MPYKSKAQQRAMHAKAERGEISKSVVNEFDEATKKKPGGFASLPEKVKKKEKKSADSYAPTALNEGLTNSFYNVYREWLLSPEGRAWAAANNVDVSLADTPLTAQFAGIGRMRRNIGTENEGKGRRPLGECKKEKKAMDKVAMYVEFLKEAVCKKKGKSALGMRPKTGKAVKKALSQRAGGHMMQRLLLAVKTASDKKDDEKKPKLGSGERFKKLEKSIASKGDVSDPAAVAAAIGRKKYGKGKFQAMAAKGK